jgi:NTE family protein
MQSTSPPPALGLSLRRVGFFRRLPAHVMAGVVDSVHQHSFPAGTPLMRQGEPGTALHLIIRGRVRVERSHEHLATPLVLAELGPGELVGPVGLSADQIRSATVVAIEDTVTVELGEGVIELLSAHYPDIAFTLGKDSPLARRR